MRWPGCHCASSGDEARTTTRRLPLVVRRSSNSKELMDTSMDTPPAFTRIDPRLEPVVESVLRRNPAEQEFHEAVWRLLGTVGPVIKDHPEYLEARLVERI